MAAQPWAATCSTMRRFRYARALRSVSGGIGLRSGRSAPSAFRYAALRGSLKTTATAGDGLTAPDSRGPGLEGLRRGRRPEPGGQRVTKPEVRALSHPGDMS